MIAVTALGLLVMSGPAADPGPTTTPLSTGPTPTIGGPVASPPPAGRTYRDFAVDTEVVRSPTTSTAQSKLWFAEGRWWGALFSPTTDRLGIFVLDPDTQTWADTGTVIDDRAIADADMLWTGDHLYAVSGGSRDSTNHAIRVRRFTYDEETARYGLDPDFPVTIRPTGASPAVIAVDSTDTAWVAYAADGRVWVSHTQEHASIWSEPVALPMREAAVGIDDVASIVAFGPGRVGVAWTNQASGVYFSTHEDGTPDDAWSPAESVLSGQAPDPGLHLTTYPLDADRTAVAAAVSTTLDDSTGGRSLDPLTLLATREADGRWTSAVVGLVRDRHARPIVLVDATGRTVAVAATSPGGGGAVFYKRSALDRIEFDTGIGTPLVATTTETAIDNATTAKGPFSADTGLLVLASDRTTGAYLHSVVDLGGGLPAADPTDPDRPTAPAGPPKGPVTLFRDTFDPWPVGAAAPTAWYVREEDVPGRLSIVEDGATARALRVSAAGAGVRACRDMAELPDATVTVRARVRLSRVVLDDVTLLSVRGSGGEAASVRVTNKGVLAWFDGSTKIRTTRAIRPGAWYRLTVTIRQATRRADIRVTTDDASLLAKPAGLRWRMPAVRVVDSVCVETSAGTPAHTIDIAEVSVIGDVQP